jgi:hypothetical protein
MIRRFKNIGTFTRALQKDKKLINESTLIIDNVQYNGKLLGGEKEKCYLYFESEILPIQNIRIDYTLHKIKDNHYQGIKTIDNVEVFYE